MQNLDMTAGRHRRWGLPALLAVVLALAGCAAPPKTLYQWGSYQASLYNYFKGNGSDPGAMILQLEEQLQKTAATGGAAPPGLHGHLALLYSKVGDDANAVAHLEAERKLFPESGVYIGMLLQRAAVMPAKVPPLAAPATPSAPAAPTSPASAAKT